MNERITENIVRSLLREKGYYDDKNILIEEQSSKNPKIDKLLKSASKSGNGVGKPEFIISFKDNPDDVIVIECKANISYHESKERDKYKDYAVDGVLLYASYLKEGFNTTAIAVSGETEREKKISTFLWLKQHYTYKDIQDKIFLKSAEIEGIVKEQSKPFAEEELIKKAIDYNSFLHNYSIPEVERCTLISAILIALQNTAFLHSYKHYISNKELIDGLLSACESVLKKNNLDLAKTEVIISEYSKFKNNNDFNSDAIYNKKTKKDEVNTLLRDFIASINQDILPHINESEFDVLGKFYTQFIRYAGSDKKTGLVLTPTHITDFFCDIAELSIDDIVFDPCCGTAGFLVSAMNYMLKKAGNDTERQQKIKSSQLIGIEKRSDMFSHACSNMMMRGDGKSHILYGSCFDEKNKDIIKQQKPTKGFLNPPYQDGNADEQLEFIENTLECLVKDGICIAICQFSTVVSKSKNVLEVKKRLLEKHTLEAVFSMPNDLFHPVTTTPTCIIVFKAHIPHSHNKKTFFGYFKEDGFIKTKDKGRIDKNNTFKQIKEQWICKYFNKENIAGLSITKGVTAEDEWCAEAYMETDYNQLSQQLFANVIKEYVVNKLYHGDIYDVSSNIAINNIYELKNLQWRSFKYGTIIQNIEIAKSKDLNSLETADEGINYVSRSRGRNNIIAKITNTSDIMNFINNGNCITIPMVGESTCYCFWQDKDFFASQNILILRDKKLNKYTSLFINTIIRLEIFRFSYGRTLTKDFANHTIKLPTTPKGEPDWQFMENYIKSLPYSSSL